MKKYLLWGGAALAIPVISIAVWTMLVLKDLPDVSVLKHYRPAAASEVLDRNGSLIAHFYDRKFRLWVPITTLPDVVIQAIVTAEDDTFFGHQGVNYQAVWEALKHDVQKKRFARGGSTITQQMIKNVLLSKEKTVTRKIREFVLARKAEEVLTKRQILEIYLNEVEWGDAIYGIEAAARFYFDKHASELRPAEAALLAGMLPNPRYYNPFKRMDKARKRQEQVLFNMFQAKLLTEDGYSQAMEMPLTLRNGSSSRFDLSRLSDGGSQPCHLKALEELLLEAVGEHRLYREGITVRTTIDKELQNSLVASTATGSMPGDVPERVLVMKEGMEIRAIACSANEDQARIYPGSLGTPQPSYEILMVPIRSIRKDEIVAGPRPAVDSAPTDTLVSGEVETRSTEEQERQEKLQ
ncbi:MAG: transglycosylase domain-containing protein [Nitrospirota bacterium]